MKFYLAVAFLLLSASVNAALETWEVDISVNDDGSSDWIATLTYNETVTKSDYFLLSGLSNLEVFADNQSVQCEKVEEIGTSVLCNNIAAKEIVYKFHTKSFVDNFGNLKIFNYPFSAIQAVDKMHITLRLPLGAAVVEEFKLAGTGLRPFEPDFGRRSSDGRRIFVSWTVDRPVLGQRINLYIIYELLGIDPFTTFVIIFTLTVAAFITVIIYLLKRHNVKNILPVLTGSERKIMEIILRERGSVDQRIIVRETEFSKAKVSRIINDLIGRGLLEKVSRGRKNIIKLKKEVKVPKEQPDKQEK